MIPCDSVQEFLLEADLANVRESHVGIHLEKCATCSAMLCGLEVQERALSNFIGELAATVAPAADPAGVRGVDAKRRPSKVVPWRVMIPLAAAALGSLTLFGSWGRTDGPFTGGPDWTLPVASLRSAQPVVRSSSHEWVAILPTENPDITVIWFAN